ncbi:MAG: type II toxin-antitoxin system CcdA family antitoxin [Dechloromonas sp.]|jgi:antitoxin CcdA|nr:type II toxin-antitoxin system CcdA family antitoxin [Dechloromonas sp.]
MIIRIKMHTEIPMLASELNAARKGRLSLSISQELLDRLEPYKQQINLSAHTEALLAQLLETLENRAWLERNADAIIEHGKLIAATGLAGEEFDRI